MVDTATKNSSGRLVATVYDDGGNDPAGQQGRGPFLEPRAPVLGQGEGQRQPCSQVDEGQDDSHETLLQSPCRP